MSPLRLGVLGAANIAKLFARGVAGSPLVSVDVVASRDAAKAAEFAKAESIPRSHGSYEALLADLMEGFRNFMAADGDVIGPAMRSLRHSLLMNNVHPILDVVLDLLRDPAQNRDFFEAIFKMARRHPSEFEAAIGLLGDMTRADDGRMKDVVGAAVRVFSKFAQTGASAVSVEPREVPVLDASRLRAHSWSRSDLFPVVPQLLPEWKGCSTLSPTARLDQYEDPAQSAALDSYNPPHKLYRELKKKLAELRGEGDKPVIKIADGETLRYQPARKKRAEVKMDDPRVPQLRARLGITENADSTTYDAKVASAVRKFQDAADIPATGTNAAGPGQLATILTLAGITLITITRRRKRRATV